MSPLDRRSLLAGLGVSGALLAAAPSVWAGVLGGSSDGFLDRLCDLTIPDTDTPGARAVGVPAFLRLAVAHGLEKTGPETLVRLEGALDRVATLRSGVAFTQAPPAVQAAILTEVDAKVFAGHGPSPTELGDLSLWLGVKSLILAGYYTSEVGGSVELAYDLVPGRWDADIALKPGDRAFSSDWTALEFG